MNREEFTSICREVETGEHKFVQNLESLYSGKVVACGDRGLTVEVFGHRVEWNVELCRLADSRINPLGPPTNS